MKRAYLLLTLLMTISLISCKNEKAADKIKTENVEIAAQRDEAAKKLPIMTFTTTEHDFGNIPKGTPVEKVFEFTNTGNAPLIITNATSSCGCTVPEYPKDSPIAPGATGQLLVKYNASGKNQISKTVTVTANTEKGNETIVIKAFVEAGDEPVVTPTAPAASK